MTTIETSTGQLFRVTECGDADLAHTWFGTPVKRTRAGFADKANAKSILIRKAGCRVVSSDATEKHRAANLNAMRLAWF